jgi:excisionase family DNA binding protein
MSPLLTVEAVAELLSVSTTLVYRLKDSGELPFYKIGKGAVRFSIEDIESYLLQKRENGRATEAPSLRPMQLKHLRI